MENKQYYVEFETESNTEIYEYTDLKDARDCVNEIKDGLINIQGYTDDFENVTANEYTEENFIEGLENINHGTFLKICYGDIKQRKEFFEYLKTKFEEASEKHNGFGNSEEMDLITKQIYDSVGFQKANEFFDHLDDLPF